MSSSDVAGVILGAGESKRFGPPKQLLPLGDTTLLGYVVRTANASQLDRVVAVLGRAADEVRTSVDFGRAVVVDNTRFGTGCASSILAGLEAAEGCAAILLILGDQPGVTTEILNTARAAWQQERPWACITSYRGVLGHPFVFSEDAFDELRRLHGDKAVWKLIDQYPGRFVRVEVDAELPLDVDTEEDYNRVVRELGQAAAG